MSWVGEPTGQPDSWAACLTQADARPLLNIAEDKFVTAIITAGYAVETPAPRKRKPLSTVCIMKAGKPVKHK